MAELTYTGDTDLVIHLAKENGMMEIRNNGLGKIIIFPPPSIVSASKYVEQDQLRQMLLAFARILTKHQYEDDYILETIRKFKTDRQFTVKPQTESAISSLNEDQHYFISLISQVFNELVNKKIITPTQRKQSTDYMLEKMGSGPTATETV